MMIDCLKSDRRVGVTPAGTAVIVISFDGSLGEPCVLVAVTTQRIAVPTSVGSTVV
jgi:hypothetical protein